MRPLDEPVICPIVVGRDLQLGLLERLFDAAEHARGETVLLAGEAGIGKSRLIGAARELALKRGWPLVQGSFFEPDHSLPYAGLTDLVRRYLAAIPAEQAAILASEARELSRLVPELDLLAEAAPSQQGEQDRRRLFQAFSQLLLAISDGHPVAVVLEDLHWADDASLELLLHVARLTRTNPFLLLLTYRDDEVQPSLAHFLAGLERERLASEIRLDRLPAADVDRMLRAILQRDRPIRAEVLHTIHELTDGNPFFVEEVVRSLPQREGGIWDGGLAAAARIPHSVEESVQRRSQGLSDTARGILELAAVAGRRFDFPLLLRLSGLDEPGLMTAIKELIAAQLVVEESEDQFSFRHALTRQAIYSGLLLRERKLLHKRIKETIALIYAPSLEEKYGDLAYHALQAEDWAEALTFSSRAGERALSFFSPGSAVEHFSRALEAAAHVPGASVGAMHRGRGKACEVLGDFEGARTDFEEALAVARAHTDAPGEWEAVLDLGMLWAGKDYTRTGEYFEQAFQLAQAMGDQATIARSLNRVGNWYVNVEQPRAGIQRHEQALAIFEALADKQGIADTLDLLGMSTLILGDLVKSTEYYRRAVGLFEELNDQPGLASSLATLPIRAAGYHADCNLVADTLPDARWDGFRALKITRDIGWRPGESFALWDLAMCLGPQGEYGQALEFARLGLEIAEEIEHTQWQAAAQATNGVLFHDLLANDRALVHLDNAYELAVRTGSLFWQKHSAALLSRVLIALRELARAESLLAPLREAGRELTLAQRQIEGAWAELCLTRGDATEALVVLAPLLAPAGTADGRQVARLARLQGDALASLGRYDEAEKALAGATTAAVYQGRNHLLWRVQASLAGVELGRKDVHKAATLAEATRLLVEELALKVPEGALRENFVGSAVGQIPGLRHSRPAGQAGGAFGLTTREQEMAVLVAKGLSNRAIADSLVLSERTVETHVANALSKLGFSSRSQLAVWATEKGLTSPG